MVFRGPGRILYQDFPDPVLENDHEAILRVSRSSICGSDLHIYHGKKVGYTEYNSEMPPFCVGHEFIGTVVEKGKGVQSFSVDDEVIAAGSVGCGACHKCLSGQPMLCRQNVGLSYGSSAALNGGEAQYVKIPHADLNLAKRPEGISSQDAILLTDQLPTAYMGAKMANIHPGDSVAVLGLGSVGLLAVECAFFLGAARVFAMDLVKERCDVAARLGATIVDTAAAKQEIRELTDGNGVDAVIEAAGSKQTIELSTKIVRFEGTISTIGVPDFSAIYPIGALFYKSLTVKTAICSVQNQWKELMPLVKAGRIDGSYVFTHEMDLSQGEKAYKMFDARENGCIKIILNSS